MMLGFDPLAFGHNPGSSLVPSDSDSLPSPMMG